jgi:hypothetical protein
MGFLLIGAPPYAAIDNAPDLACVRRRVTRRAPNAGDAELAAPAILVVERAVDLAPSMAAAQLNAPAVRFRVSQCGFDLLVGVSAAAH